MKTLAKTVTHAFAALGLAGAAISPAFAGEAEKMTINVKTSDLNLASAEGQSALDQRIARAARTVCRVTDQQTGTRLMNQEARACLAKARSDARQQVAALIQDRQRGG